MEETVQHVQMPHKLGERLNNQKLLPVDKLVYVYMRKYADKDGVTFVSIEHLAAECRLNQRTVSASLNRLLSCEELYLMADKIGRSKAYKFNMDSDKFEMFSFDCLNELSGDYSTNEKCVIIGIHEFEFKRQTYGIITYDLEDLALKVNMSIPVLKKTIKSLEAKGVMITKRIPGQTGLVRQVDYKKIFQDILYTKKKVDEHDIEINELKEQNAQFQEQIEYLNNELKYLRQKVQSQHSFSF